MGSMLSRLHHRASVDACDVEFVPGGDGQLVSAFFANDPYYPHPRRSDTLYNHFKIAYLDACGGDSEALASAFFGAVELTQAQRDAKRTQDI